MSKPTRTRPSIWLLATALVLVGCATKQDLARARQVSERGQRPTTQELARASKVSQREQPFGKKLWGALPHKKSLNTLVSPFSIATALSLLRNGIGGPSAKDLSKALSATDINSLNSGQRTISRAMVASGQTTVSNAIFAEPGIRFNPAFLQVASTSYGATVEPLKDLGSAGEKQVNDWVSTHTKGRINQVIDRFEKDEVLILLNAITFDGLWETPFQIAETKPLPFSTPTGKVLTPQMHLESSFAFSSHNGLKALELPYKGQEFSMFLMLPKSGKTPEDLVARIDPFLEVSRLHCEDTDVLLPRFKFTNSYALKEPLSKIGLGRLFKRCDFMPMAPGSELGCVSRVIHETYIEVDEKGTKAAAATTIGAMAADVSEPIQPKQFHANRPFAFWILYKPTHTVLFFGTVKDPHKKQ